MAVKHVGTLAVPVTEEDGRLVLGFGRAALVGAEPGDSYRVKEYLHRVTRIIADSERRDTPERITTGAATDTE